LLATLILCAGWIAAICGIVMYLAIFTTEASVIPADLHIIGDNREGGAGPMWGADAMALRDKLAPALQERMVLARTAIANVSDGFRPTQNDALWIDGPLFGVLGWSMLQGKDFSPQDFAEDSESVIISYRFWLDQFAGANDVVGQSIQVEGKKRRVIGVLPRFRAFPYQQKIYLPTRFTPNTPLSSRYLITLLRVNPSERDDLQTLASAVVKQSAEQAAQDSTDSSDARAEAAEVRVLQYAVTGMNRESKFITSLIALFSLLLLALAACNAGGLLLIRWVLRSAELATRASLGATTTRLAAAAIAQALLISLVALGLALVISKFIGEAAQHLLHTSANGSPEYVQFQLGFSALLPMLSALFLSVLVVAAPVVWRLVRGNLSAELKRRERGLSADYRTGKALLFFQCVFAVASLALTVTCLWGEQRANSADFGFRSDRVLVSTIRHSDPAKLQAFVDSLSAKLRRERKVQAVTLGLAAPQYAITTRELRAPLQGPDQPTQVRESAEEISVEFAMVAPDFPGVYPMRLLAGRWFTASASAQDLELVINRDMAKRWFKSTDAAVNQTLLIPEQTNRSEKRYRVIGVVDNARFDIHLNAEKYVAYVLSAKATLPLQVLSILTDYDRPQTLIPRLEQLALEVDESFALSKPMVMSERLRQSTASYSMISNLFLPLGLLAGIMAASGFASLLATLIAQKLRDCSLRRALGAPAARLVAPLLRPLLPSFALGLLIGLLAVAPLIVQVNTLIYGDSLPLLPILLATIFALLLAVALACIRPIWRALSADPMEILRQI
jgi:putative ABC transport system permease protein